MADDILLEVKGLKKHFTVRRNSYFDKKVLKAVDGVDISLRKGEVYGLVGESGCGKSTVGRLIAGIIPKTEGEIKIYTDIQESHKQVQMIFQNSHGSLNPRKKIGAIIEEPLLRCFDYTKAVRKEMVEDIMAKTGLDKSLAGSYPHELSGGQRQRVNIATSLMLGAPLLIADESVSALDVSIQSQILNLLLDLKADKDLSYIFISHDLNVIRYISSHIGVMYLGKIVESGHAAEVTSNPKHPYTRMLLGSIPSLFEKKEGKTFSRGEFPDPLNPPKGCGFSPRCPDATGKCFETAPEARYGDDGRMVRCHLA